MLDWVRGGLLGGLNITTIAPGVGGGGGGGGGGAPPPPPPNPHTHTQPNKHTESHAKACQRAEIITYALFCMIIAHAK